MCIVYCKICCHSVNNMAQVCERCMLKLLLKDKALHTEKQCLSSSCSWVKRYSTTQKYSFRYVQWKSRSIALFVNTLGPRQNGRNFADEIFKWIFLNENA